MSRYVVTGSATADGAPIYLGRDGEWSRRVEDARTFEQPDERDAQLEAARRAQFVVCDPYAIEVADADARVEPITLKEKIRAHGPTVAYGDRGEVRDVPLR